ncbi:hypothetical protein T492DRAFT_399664 [Pavlovales sp. CCMP2436]|nr:hypothetical protein T492DRAFT_399664 [Pavlovales sp. CCMP2436]
MAPSRMSSGSAASVFKKMNYFKKMPDDLTISTNSGSIITMVGALAMALLFVLEFSAFLSLKVETLIEPSSYSPTAAAPTALSGGLQVSV